MKRPKVTVLMPAFNAQRFIADAISSILSQGFPDFELLVIDDGSDDATRAVARLFVKDTRLRLITHDRNMGSAYTRNQGLDLARGEYVAMLDADDLCAPERLARQVAYLDTAPDIAVLGSWVKKIDQQGKVIAPGKGRRPTRPQYLDAHILFKCPLYQPSVMARTRLLRTYRYRERFPIAEDYDLWSRLAERYRMAVLPDRLTAYRIHAHQVTSAKTKLLKQYTQTVHIRQLQELGIVFDQNDLDNHFLLDFGGQAFHRRTGRALDLSYLEWADDWLVKLLVGNTAANRFHETALRHTIGRIWLNLCRKTARHNGAGAWRYFWRSQLKQPALASLVHKR